MPRYTAKKEADPLKKPKTAGNWEGFARNVAAGMNQTQAYIAAGFSEGGARQCASDLIRKPYVQKLLWELGQKAEIEPIEVLCTLRMHMLGSIEDFLDEDGKYTLKYALGTDKMRLIKHIDHDQDGNIVNIELYNAQAAAVALIKCAGLEQAPRMNNDDAARMRQIAMEQLKFVMNKYGMSEEDARAWMLEYGATAAKYLM